MAIEKIDVESRLFDGVARVIMFPDVDPTLFTEATTLADVLKSGKDLGKIIEGSPSWDGDEAEIEVLQSTEGDVIRSKNTPGTFAWSVRIPHSVQSAKLAGAVTHTATSLGSDFSAAADAEILGLNPKDMNKRCPIGILNLTRSEFALFPKAGVIFSPGLDDDDLTEYTVKAQAESITTKNLSTMMFIPLGKDPLAATTEP